MSVVVVVVVQFDVVFRLKPLSFFSVSVGVLVVEVSFPVLGMEVLMESFTQSSLGNVGLIYELLGRIAYSWRPESA